MCAKKSKNGAKTGKQQNTEQEEKKQDNPSPKIIGGLKDPLWRKPKRNKGDSEDGVPPAVNVLQAASHVDLDDRSGESWPWRYFPASEGEFDSLVASLPFEAKRVLLLLSRYGQELFIEEVFPESPKFVKQQEAVDYVGHLEHLDILREEILKRGPEWALSLVGADSDPISRAPPWFLASTETASSTTPLKPFRGKKLTVLDRLHNCLRYVDYNAGLAESGDVASIAWGAFAWPSKLKGMTSIGIVGLADAPDDFCSRLIAEHDRCRQTLRVASDIWAVVCAIPAVQAVLPPGDPWLNRVGEILRSKTPTECTDAIRWLCSLASSVPPTELPTWREFEEDGIEEWLPSSTGRRAPSGTASDATFKKAKQPLDLRKLARKTPPDFMVTRTELMDALEVKATKFNEIRRLPGFPQPVGRRYDLDAVDSWCEENDGLLFNPSHIKRIGTKYVEWIKAGLQPKATPPPIVD